MSNDGGPAYPVAFTTTPLRGMSLREWFAGQVISGLCANQKWLENAGNHNNGDALGAACKAAFEAADEMIKEHSK